MAVLQGLSKHISLNSKKLRKHFVDFDGKQIIKVIRDNFVKGGDNDWNGVYEEISKDLRQFIGENNYNLLSPKFSTTNVLETQVFNVTMMNCLKS